LQRAQNIGVRGAPKSRDLKSLCSDVSPHNFDSLAMSSLAFSVAPGVHHEAPVT